MNRKFKIPKWIPAFAVMTVIFCSSLVPAWRDHSSLLLASQMGGDGMSVTGGQGQTYQDIYGNSHAVSGSFCAGGPPIYCARTDFREIQSSDPSINYVLRDPIDGGPAVGTPFVDPNSGERIVRVTDEGITYPLVSDKQNNIGVTDSSSESTICGAPLINSAYFANGDQGYLCNIQTAGCGGSNPAPCIFFSLDGKTMQTVIIAAPSNYAGNFSLTDSYLLYPTWSVNELDQYCFSGAPSNDTFCGTGKAGLTQIVALNTTTCPNIPSRITGNTLNDVVGSANDNIVLGSVNSVVIAYNRTTRSCDWFDEENAVVGGTDFTGTPAETPAPQWTDTVHQARISHDGTIAYITLNSTNWYLGWILGTANVNATPIQETGHTVMGSKKVADVEYVGTTGILQTALINFQTNPATLTSITSAYPNYAIWVDTHSTWTDANAADTYPFCGSTAAHGYGNIGWSYSGTETAPNGTYIRYPNSGYNAVFNTSIPLMNEIWCAATDGSRTVYRFGYSRSNFYTYNSSSAGYGTNFYASNVLGSMTPDGKFYVFNSYWDWRLGTPGLLGWSPGDAVTSGEQVLDVNENIETAGSNFTTGTSVPTWSTTVGGTTSDNGGTWTMSLGCPTAATCRSDVFVMELR